MTEYNEVQRIVAESYRTKIDAEELRREVKAILNGIIKEAANPKSEDYPHEYASGMIAAYKHFIWMIDEKEKGR